MKLLTFLFALTFLFLFSGTSFGGVFNKNDPTVIRCDDLSKIRIVISMKDKTIKYFGIKKLYSVYTIEDETEAYITGLDDIKSRYVILSRHEYQGIIRIFTGFVNDGKFGKNETYSCRIKIKKF